MEAKDMREFINSGQGQIERILYAIDQMKTSMIGVKILVLQLVKKKEAS